MIVIVDYGLGNIKAFANVYHKLNIPIIAARNAQDLSSASKIILPGVGSFDRAMELLNLSGMREELDRLVIQEKVPVLGVCVGMQMMASSSEEGLLPGLGWIDTTVKKFQLLPEYSGMKVPHMGWNHVEPVIGDALFYGLDQTSKFYFLHSYYFPSNSFMSASTNYYFDFASAIKKDNIYGVQFHPEKSHEWGVLLLANYYKL